MSELWQGILIGAAISIPMGILANFIFKWLDKKAEGRSAAALAKHKAAEDSFEKKAQRLSGSEVEYTIYLQESLLGLMHRLILGIFLLSLAFIIDQLLRNVDGVFVGVGQFVILLTFGIASFTLMRAVGRAEQMIRMVSRVVQIKTSITFTLHRELSAYDKRMQASRPNDREQVHGSDKGAGSDVPQGSSADLDPQPPLGQPPAS